MLTRVAFAFCVNFMSPAPVMPESLAPRIAANTIRINPPASEDFGLESISEELPIVEPEPAFKSQVIFMAPMPAQKPKNPQINTKPAAKLPIPRAMGPELPKIPGIPQANMKSRRKVPPRVTGPELPKILASRTEQDDIKAVKTSAILAQESRKDPPEGDGVKPALRQQAKTDMQVKLKTIDLMEQCLYHTQDGNMLNVEEMATRYQMTKQYRMAFIVLKMEEVKNEMHTIYSYLQKKLTASRKIKIVNQIYYYTHLLKKNIDITYAVEYLIENFSEM